jgi:hypothetical protein
MKSIEYRSYVLNPDRGISVGVSVTTLTGIQLITRIKYKNGATFFFIMK